MVGAGKGVANYYGGKELTFWAEVRYAWEPISTLWQGENSSSYQKLEDRARSPNQQIC